MIDETKEQEQKTINIYPCKNTRRILVFLADFFICFIAAVFLFEIVVRPIAYSSMGYKKVAQETEIASRNNLKILADNELLYFNELTDGNYSDSIRFSCKQFTSDFCLNKEEKEHDVFSRYYKNFKDNNIDELISFYNEKATKYFDVDTINKTVDLKQEYKNLFLPLFVESDEISKTGEKEYSKFEEEFYLYFYSEIIVKDVLNNDLSSPIHPEFGTYKSNDQLIKSFNDKIKLTVNIGSAVTFVITMAIFYFIIPLTNQKRRTIAEIILKVERVDIKTLKYLKRRFVVTEGIMNTLTNTIMIFIIPFITYGIDLVFTLTELLTLSIVGLVFLIIQFILLLATKMNQTLKEFATHSICVDTSTMDTYFREKGYDF